MAPRPDPGHERAPAPSGGQPHAQGPGAAPVRSGETPRFSLVVTTIGRAEGLPKLMASLAAQTLPPAELVVVDQNDDQAAVAAGLAGDWPFPVAHLHVPGVRGASRGRNIGAAQTGGDVLVYPDDDCWYPPDFLAKAARLLSDPGLGFVCGRATDETGRTINGRFEAQPHSVDRRNVWTTSIEWLQILRREAVEAVGGYDEAIGVGAATPWQSAEAQDLLLRVLAAGARGHYDPDLVGHHAELPVARPDAALRRKLRRYARGMGHVLRKHRFGPGEAGKWLVRPLGGLAFALARLKLRQALLFLHVAVGRVEGYTGSLLTR
jgi:glycosyltransferase involved in cell wall biosynthesis